MGGDIGAATAAAAERGDYLAATALAACAVLAVAAREGAGLVRWLLARLHPAPPPAPTETPSTKQRALDAAVAAALSKQHAPKEHPTPPAGPYRGWSDPLESLRQGQRDLEARLVKLERCVDEIDGRVGAVERDDKAVLKPVEERLQSLVDRLSSVPPLSPPPSADPPSKKEVRSVRKS